MTISCTPGSAWPSRICNFSAAVFIAASGTINVTYGFAKGDTLASSIIWAAVAGAVAAIFALSWPALIRSLEARRWSVALLLAGTYSVTAALGSAGGGRTNAAAAETATADARKRLQAQYDAAAAELTKIPDARPVAEVQALLSTAKQSCRIIVANGRRDTVCAPNATLSVELGRSRRRAELEVTLAKVSGELNTLQPPKQANSDARTLACYLSAIGLDATAERLNDLLVLLSVLMIEIGGGLSLALGMALAALPASHTEARTPAASDASGHSRTPPADAADTPANGQSVQAERTRPMAVVGPSAVAEWLEQQGGRAQTSMRRLANALGRSPSGVHDELRRLVASGAITAASDSRGTMLALARPN